MYIVYQLLDWNWVKIQLKYIRKLR